MRRRLLTVVVGLKFDLDKSGVHRAEERRADMGVFQHPTTARWSSFYTVVFPQTSSKRLNGDMRSGFQKHMPKKQTTEGMHGSVLQCIQNSLGGVRRGINYILKKNKKKTALATCEAHKKTKKQLELKRVEVASSWLDFPLLFSASMDLTRG